jgi:hypothetical protein
MLLPHFFLVYTFYTTMFPSFYPAPHDLHPAKRPKMRFCVASIRRMLSSRRTCRWHADGAMMGKYGYSDIPIKNWINNDSYGLYTGWWLTYPSEK